MAINQDNVADKLIPTTGTLTVSGILTATTVNISTTAGSGTTNYLTFVASAIGSQPQYTNTGLTYNATNNAITGGIQGGTF